MIWLLLAACHLGAPPETAAREQSMDCTVRIAPGEDVAAAVAGGGTVCLSAGEHRGALFVERSVTIVGEPGAVLDAGGRGSVVHVAADDLQVVVRGVTLRNGAGELGGGLRVDGWSQVSVEDCTFEGNRVREGRGHGLGVARGQVSVVRSRFSSGQALMLTGLAEVTIEGSELPEVAVREKAQVTIRGGLVGTLSIRGTTTRAPKVVLQGVEVASIDNDESLPGELVRE